MRTTVIIPDDIIEEIQRMTAGSSMSGFIREAVVYRLDYLRHGVMAREMAEGYRAEAVDPSLDPEWNVIEAEGW